MTKQEMKLLLNELTKESGCYNEVAVRFMEQVARDHLRINPHSCDPGTWTDAEKTDPFKFWIIERI